MATIAADAILGYTAGRALRLTGWQSLYLVAMANLPDADYLPGLIFSGDASESHRNIGMHTPYFAVLVGAVVLLLYRWGRPRDSWPHAFWWADVSALMVLGHLVLDRLDLPYWHETGWMALPAEAVNSVVDMLVLGPVVVLIWWAARFRGVEWRTIRRPPPRR